MQARIILFLTLVTMAASVAACGGSSTSTPSSGSNSDTITITLATNPDPPEAGEVELVVTLIDVSGKPLDDAEVSLIASHMDMSGMDLSGKTTAQGNGRYTITADLGMSGNWLLTVEVRGVSSDVIRKDFDLGLK